MNVANPFAQPPISPEPIIAQVRRQLLADAGDTSLTPTEVVDGMVDRVVRELWNSRVKTFVPVLALRETRELLRVERSLASPPSREAPLGTGELTGGLETAVAGSGRDRLVSARDALAHERRDVLHADGDVLRL